MATPLVHVEAGRAAGPVCVGVLHGPQVPEAEGNHRSGSVRTGGRWVAIGSTERKVRAHVRRENSDEDLLSGSGHRRGHAWMG